MTAEPRTDVEMALLLAANAPSGPVAVAVRARLRRHIADLDEDAEAYVAALPDGRSRDIAEDTLRWARDLRSASGNDPAIALRLLAKATTFLLRYAQTSEEQ